MGWKGTTLSLALHVGVIGYAGVYKAAPKTREKTALVVRSPAKPKEAEPEKPKPPKKEPPPPPKPKAPPQEVKKPQADAAKPAEPAVEKRAPVDLGMMLGNDAGGGDSGGGGGGVAIPVGPGREPERPRAEEPKRPRPVPAAPKQVEKAEALECTEAVTKPVPTTKVEIEYSVEAREAGLEGRLVLRVFVKEDGTVERVEVVTGIGPALDGAAVAAVQQWRFEPATQCGKPVAGVYTLARRFELGD